MNDKISNRLEDLYDVLLYDSNEQTLGRPACFTTLERICINQERGSLLSQINEDNHETDKRFYQCHAKLETKIKFAIKKILPPAPSEGGGVRSN